MSQEKPGRTYIDWAKVPLGKFTDGAVAEKLGVQRQAVQDRRTSLGLDAADPEAWNSDLIDSYDWDSMKRSGPRKYKKRGSFDWNSVDWARTNRAIADDLGCSTAAVRYRRKTR